MKEAYVCSAVRTAVGRRNGSLSREHPADLGGLVIDALLDRSGMEPAAVDDVIFGCVSQIGPQSSNLARASVISSRLPESVPGVTLDRQCGSSQQAAHFAAQAVLSGTQDVVIAGGVEVMSMVPILSAMAVGMEAGMPSPFAGREISRRYANEDFSQFVGAERLAAKYGVTAEELLGFAARSHERAIRATEEGRFEQEIVPVWLDAEDGRRVVFDQDEGMRAPDLDKMRSLPALLPGGIITAATSSQISDGASAILVANERGVERHGLSPMARVVAMDVIGSDPTVVLEGPIPASQRVLERAGLTLGDIDLYEVNEAFGSVPLAWARALGADPERLNVNGGAQALGHPLGATGTKLITTLIHELRRREKRLGLVAICEGLGTANATIIERL